MRVLARPAVWSSAQHGQPWAEAVRRHLQRGLGLKSGDLGEKPPKQDCALAQKLSGGREWFCGWASGSFLILSNPLIGRMSGWGPHTVLFCPVFVTVAGSASCLDPSGSQGRPSSPRFPAPTQNGSAPSSPSVLAGLALQVRNGVPISCPSGVHKRFSHTGPPPPR